VSGVWPGVAFSTTVKDHTRAWLIVRACALPRLSEPAVRAAVPAEPGRDAAAHVGPEQEPAVALRLLRTLVLPDRPVSGRRGQSKKEARVKRRLTTGGLCRCRCSWVGLIRHAWAFAMQMAVDGVSAFSDDAQPLIGEDGTWEAVDREFVIRRRAYTFAFPDELTYDYTIDEKGNETQRRACVIYKMVSKRGTWLTCPRGGGRKRAR
jgi:hypothetical protein